MNKFIRLSRYLRSVMSDCTKIELRIVLLSSLQFAKRKLI
jgi:hypothetical protein